MPWAVLGSEGREAKGMLTWVWAVRNCLCSLCVRDINLFREPETKVAFSLRLRYLNLSTQLQTFICELTVSVPAAVSRNPSLNSVPKALVSSAIKMPWSFLAGLQLLLQRI